MRYDLECPRCGKQSFTIAEKTDKKPRFHCGDCLMNDVEIVVMLATERKDETDNKL